MKLYETAPDSVTVNGRKVRLNLDFRNVLKMIDILEQDDLMPDAREWLAMKCVCRRPVKGMKPAVMKLLFPKAENREQITDMAQDADLIRAAFRQAYGINLYTDKLHWFEFCCLLSGIPEGTRYSDVLGIRTREMPEPTAYNQKERQRLARAKAEFGLKLTEKEQKEKYRSDVKKLGDFMIMMAGGSEKNG